jgi:hypothetical protein
LSPSTLPAKFYLTHEGEGGKPDIAGMCLMAGLTLRNTMYSFRRTACKETRRNPKGGDDVARELISHAPGTKFLFAYDDDGLSAIDITAFRLRSDTTYSPQEIAKMFSQAKTNLFQAIGRKNTLLLAIDARVEAKLPEDEEYVALERRLHNLFLESAVTLQLPD